MAGAAALAGCLLGSVFITLAVGPLIRVWRPDLPVLDETGKSLALTEKAVPLDDVEFVTILVAGMDSARHVDRPPSSQTTFGTIPLMDVRGRADSIFILGLDRRTQGVRVLHIPRDTIVNIPGRGRGKLGELMAYVSFAEFKKTVEDITQMPLERYVVIDFEGFKSLVDAIGGVTLTVDHDLSNPDGIWLKRGTHTLDGAQALRFVRHRYSEKAQDISRIQLQYQFLVALGQKLASGGFMTAFAAYRRSPDVLKTNLTPSEVIHLWQEWRAFDPAKMEHLSLPGVPEAHYWRLDPAGVKDTLERFWPHGWDAEEPPAGASELPAEGPPFVGAGESFTRCLGELTGIGRRGLWALTYAPYLRPRPAGPAPPVLVYHTHATESFMPELIPDPDERAAHDPNREAFSADMSLTVARVGGRLSQRLYELGFDVTHDLGIHDHGGSRGRGGAYSRSRASAMAALQGARDPVLILDVHRDATTVRTEVGSRTVAALLFVVARQNPWWQWNYVFAHNLDAAVRAVAPGLSRGVRILDGRYNEDLSPLALIVEIGGADSTMAECLASADILAGVLAEYVGEP